MLHIIPNISAAHHRETKLTVVALIAEYGQRGRRRGRRGREREVFTCEMGYIQA